MSSVNNLLAFIKYILPTWQKITYIVESVIKIVQDAI